MNPILIIGIGNPSRGDDALGPLLIDRLHGLNLPGVELLTDFQLQVEHTLDIQGRHAVVMVDAAASGPEPFFFTPITPATDVSYSSHAMTPQALLATYSKLNLTAPPQSFLLGIRGYFFELGTEASVPAQSNLDEAQSFLSGWLQQAACVSQ